MAEPLQKQPDLPERIAERLRADIATRYRPGDKIETIRVLTKRFDVSINTMRAALSILAREGVLEMWQGSGIYVSECGDQRPVGVLMELDFSWPDVSFFWRRVTQQVRLRLGQQGLKTRFYAGFHQPVTQGDPLPCQEFMDDVMQDRLKGVIVTHGSPRPGWANLLKQRGIPIVGHWPDFENYVTFDLAGQVRRATQWLLDAGRRKLAFMDWGTMRPGQDSRDDFFEAFAGVLAERSIPLNEGWVRCEFHPNMPGAGWEEFREIWTGSAEKPDGLVVTDDVLFRGVARAIGEFGIRVPEQLQVCAQATLGAMEDYPFPLGRMVIDPDAAAQAQVDLMLQLLRREPVAQPKVILPVQFVSPSEILSGGAETITKQQQEAERE